MITVIMKEITETKMQVFNAFYIIPQKSVKSDISNKKPAKRLGIWASRF